jgi:hypothetical protein
MPLMVALGLGLQACSTAPMSPYQVEEQRASVREMANETDGYGEDNKLLFF